MLTATIHQPRRLRCPVRLPLMVALLLGAWARFDALSADLRLHPDEALFATFARDAAVHGRWLLPGALDKPPLSLYAGALSMHAFAVTPNPLGVLDLGWRVGEFAARLPGTFAGVVSVALVWALARRWFDAQAATWAAILTALSPFWVAYSATAFTDPLMVTLGLAAALAMARGRPAWAGAWLALAFATKQQAALLLPFVALAHDPGGRITYGVALRRFGISFALGALALLAWDAARPEASLFALAAANNDPQRAALVNIDELPARLTAWADRLSALFGPPALTLALLTGGLVGTGFRWPGRRWAALCWATSAAYLALHTLGAFNTYDRYLLPLVPTLALGAGAGLAALTQGRRRLNVALLALMAVLALTPPGYPDDDRARGREIVALARWLNARPLGTIIYDHWLGWQMGYYLGPWSDKRRVYYPDPQTQARDARRNPDRAPRYVVAPAEVKLRPWLAALAEAGFEVAPITAYGARRYRLYAVIPP